MENILEYEFHHDPFSFPDDAYITVERIAGKTPHEEILETVDKWIGNKKNWTQEQRERLADARQLFIDEQRADDASSDTSEM